MGPFTTGKKDEFVIDYDDEAVRWGEGRGRAAQEFAPPAFRAAPLHLTPPSAAPPRAAPPPPPRGALVLDEGEMRWPAPPPKQAAAVRGRGHRPALCSRRRGGRRMLRLRCVRALGARRPVCHQLVPPAPGCLAGRTSVCRRRAC
jgi:hypothetical protein